MAFKHAVHILTTLTYILETDFVFETRDFFVVRASLMIGYIMPDIIVCISFLKASGE